MEHTKPQTSLFTISRADPDDPGALFAVNMLVHTPAGDTFTLEELTEDLQSAGFTDVKLLHSDPQMNAVVQARKE